MGSREWFIRQAEAQDIEPMLRLWSGIKEIQSSIADTRAAVQGALNANPGSCLVACTETELVGTVLGAYNGWRGGIYHLAVNPSYRKQGVGRALIEECLEILRQRGALRVDLTTYDYNVRAQAFYSSMGFKERTDIKNFSFEYSHDLDQTGNKLKDYLKVE